jgi:hypothetical protein
MTVAILSAAQLAELIRPEKLVAQGFLRPQRALVVDSTDHFGEAAYHVYLVYPDDTPDSALAWSKVKPMVRWVRREIRRASGEERWPYVRVLRNSDLPAEIS